MSGRIPKKIIRTRKDKTDSKNSLFGVGGPMVGRSSRLMRFIRKRIDLTSYIEQLYKLPLFTSLINSPFITEKQLSVLRHIKQLPYKNVIENYSFNKNTPYSIIKLRQSDFTYGTVRLTIPGIYVLQEDITFNPNPENDFQPHSQDIISGKYPIPGPYQLGFFAAITIETRDVILDLRGHTLQQSLEHFLQQRFYANVELGSSPFITVNGKDQGPSSGIVGNYNAPKYFTVMNGTLGLSSHHGIHGNLMKESVLYNIKCEEFQVAGIALNGACDSILCDIEIDSTTGVRESSVGVPISFQYSQGRFIRTFLKQLKDSSIVSTLSEPPFLMVSGEKKTIDDIIQELDTGLEDTFNAIVNDGDIATAPSVFLNDSRLSDGNVYGILLHVRGVAVNGFLQERPADNDEIIGNRDLFVKNVIIRNIHADAEETVVITKYENVNDEVLGYSNVGIIKGPVGDVFDISFVTDVDGSYKSNVLANAQLILGKYKIQYEADGLKLGTTYFEQEIIDWVEQDTTSINDIIVECPEDEHGVDDPEFQDKLVYKYGLDAMAHVMKGDFGLFLSGGKNIYCQNVDVSGSTIESEPEIVAPHKDAASDLCLVATDNTTHIKENVVFNTVFEQ